MEWPMGQLFILFYFILNSEMLNRTSSHMWDRWYLPIFLFRNGFLTCMYIDSFISLMKFQSSLLTILNFSRVRPVVLKWSYIGEGAFRCSLKLSLNVLEDSAMYSSSHSTLSHLYLYMMPLFIGIWSFVFGCHQEVFDGSTHFKVYMYAMFLGHFFIFSLRPFVYGTTNVAVPSATMAITSANHPIKWLQHLPLWLSICQKSTDFNGNKIYHKHLA